MSETITSINPATGEVLQRYEHWTQSQVEEAIDRAAFTFREWRHTTFDTRCQALQRTARELENRKERLAQIMAEEMGKPISQGRAEVDKCAWVCRYFAEHGPSFLQDEPVETDPDQEAFVTFQPLGIVFAVMPWNFPLWQVFRFAAPNLMAGNVGLLKHAENVPECAKAIEIVLRAGGFPGGAFTWLPIGHEVADFVIEHPEVRGVTLTGSVPAGRAVAAKAGQYLKKTVLELGGSDPYLVLEDADVDQAAEVCAKSRLLNSGQSCIAAKRFIVVDAVREQFQTAFGAHLRNTLVDNPIHEATKVGPLARFDLRDQLHDQVVRTVAAGAACEFGGEIPRDGPLARGAYYPPTLLTGVEAHMPAFREETFGPVAALIAARDAAHAIELANQSSFGLGGAVFSRDIERAKRIAREELDTGNVAINGLVASDPRLPFGGVKDSGYGRELARFGIREFVNIKTVDRYRT